MKKLNQNVMQQVFDRYQLRTGDGNIKEKYKKDWDKTPKSVILIIEKMLHSK